MATTVIKASGGKRSQNLASLAATIRNLLKESPVDSKGQVTLPAAELHRLLGYCEQMEIIADELEEAGK